MFILPALPYPLEDLGPYISSDTLEYHHGKHHAAYTNKLNDALKDYPDLFEKSIEEILINLNDLVPETIRGAVRKNGGQFYNHSLYWVSMAPNAGGEPVGELAVAIKDQFESFEQFKDQFSKAGATQFGSGWAWLSITEDGSLEVESTLNEDTPLMHGKTPILTMDVWEHAYYLDYQNKRPDYIEAFFQVIDWVSANERYLKAKK